MHTALTLTTDQQCIFDVLSHIAETYGSTVEVTHSAYNVTQDTYQIDLLILTVVRKTFTQKLSIGNIDLLAYMPIGALMTICSKAADDAKRNAAHFK